MQGESIKDLIREIQEHESKEVMNNDYISNPDYIDNCEEILKEALDEGFDVIHLQNGDIITTGTKVIINQYSWDQDKKQMVKVLSKQSNS